MALATGSEAKSFHYGTAEPDEFSPAELVVYERELAFVSVY